VTKIVAISDIHIKRPSDEGDLLLSEFFSHPLVTSSDFIILLGDIFDLMCGPHEEYLHMYHHHFQKISEFQKSGKKIYFFEGNHDVHLEKLFHKIWKNKEVTLSQIPIVESIEGKKYRFSHGDEYDLDNHSYHKYISFIRSTPLKFFANYGMPYWLLTFLGEKASKISRKKGSRSFDINIVRTKFRHGVIEKTKGEFDFVLGGHSHVRDQFNLPGTSSIYINNGYALHTKSFIFIEDHVSKFISLR
jgi:UDP-2,3-diacylglucosamine hydrolase